MHLPIINGIYTDENSDIRISYPHNMMPVAADSGISKGYLRPTDGVLLYPETTVSQQFVYEVGANDKGAIKFKNEYLRVIGASLYRVLEDGYLTLIHTFNYGTPGTVVGNEQVSLDYSFDYLAIADGGLLFLYDGAGTVSQNTDADLGIVLDVIYIDGYFMTTDGEFIVVTELGDPFSVNPLKYGSSEVDPDPIVGLIKIRNEAYVLNRYTVEAFYNKGGELFPFSRIDGSRMMRGLVGTHAKIEFNEQIAFLGGGRNEPISVWFGLNAQTQKIATREIDQIIQTYTEEELKSVVFEKRVDLNHNQLWIRLPDIILIYDHDMSQIANTPVWFTMDYGPKNLCWSYDRWVVGNANGQIGYFTNETSMVFGNKVEWNFQTRIIYNESKGAIIHELELVCLPGRTTIGTDPSVWTSYSLDGEVWSQEWRISSGTKGERTKRLVWFQQGAMDNYRIQKFRGNSDAHVSIVRVEAQIEGLLY